MTLFVVAGQGEEYNAVTNLFIAADLEKIQKRKKTKRIFVTGKRRNFPYRKLQQKWFSTML